MQQPFHFQRGTRKHPYVGEESVERLFIVRDKQFLVGGNRYTSKQVEEVTVSKLLLLLCLTVFNALFRQLEDV